jgi:hypothetical protein
MLGLDSTIVENLRFRLYPGDSKPFDSEELSRCLKRDSMLHLSQKIGISDYRDLQCAFVNRHQDPEGLPMYTRDSTDDLQRGHSSAVAREYYALTPEDLHGIKPQMIKAFRRMSSWWQHITGNGLHTHVRLRLTRTYPTLGIEQLEVPPEPYANRLSFTAQPPGATFEPRADELMQAFKNMEQGVRSHINDAMAASLAIQSRRNPTTFSSQQQETFVPHPSLIKMLRTFLRNPSATFKTPEQAEALEIVIARDRHLLLVGPTAMGKSLVYMLPAAQRNDGITCILLPLSALHLDFDRRCGDLNIASSRWLPGANEQPRTRIVYVSPEHAQTCAFMNYLVSTVRLGLLVQFVVDEAHLVKLHSDFRFCFSALQPLITSGERGLFEPVRFSYN